MGPKPKRDRPHNVFTSIGITKETRDLIKARQVETGEMLYRLVDRLVRLGLEAEPKARGRK